MGKQPVQLEFAISENEIFRRKTPDAKTPSWLKSFWTQVDPVVTFTAILAITSLAIFIKLLAFSSQPTSPTVEQASQFKSNLPTNNYQHPSAEELLLDVVLPTPGTMIQLGLFNVLAGAEHHQIELANLGFVTRIEKVQNKDTKPSSPFEIQYVILMGPFHDDAVLKSAIKALKQQNINFFRLAKPMH